MTTAPVWAPDTSSLRSYQHKAVSFIDEREGLAALLAEMRTGKTRIALAYLLERAKRMLIVAPLSAMDIWRRDALALGYPGEIQLLLDGTVADRAKQLGEMGNGLVVTNHDSYWMPALRQAILKWKPDAVVVDEAQKIANRASKRSRFAHVFAQVPWVKYRLALTGTPITNTGFGSLYSIYLFVDPRVFGKNWRAFEERYSEPSGYMGYERKWGKNSDEIQEKLRKTAFQIAKSVALPDLPPRQDLIIPVTLGSKARAQYNEMKKHSLVRIEEDFGSRVSTAPITMTRLMRLQQITSGFLAVPGEAPGLVETVDVGDDKLRACVDFVKTAREDGERVVIVSRFRRDTVRIAEALDVPAKHIFTGDLSPREKQAFEANHRDEQIPIAVGQIQAIALGIDLDAASTGVYYCPDFSIANFTQFKDRIHGPRQTRPVGYHHLIATNTVDQFVYDALQGHADIASLVVDLDYVRNILA